MLKNILKLEGAQNLPKEEQQEVNGGMLRRRCCNPTYFCCTPGVVINGI